MSVIISAKNVAKVNNEMTATVFKIDFIGFEISSEFVVGYGLDYDQKLRNLKSIYKL